MGSSLSLQEYRVSTPYDENIWQLEAHNNYCKNYRNIETGQLAEQYIVELPTDRIRQEMSIYEDRYFTKHPNIVRVYYAGMQRPKTMCSSKQLIKVRTEAIPYRLNQMPLMTTAESLYALRQSFAGFSEIVNMYGHIRIDPQMIGFTSDGKVKVWLNPNFSKTFPQEHMLFISEDSDETLTNSMVKQITDMVEMQTIGNKLPDWLRLNLHRVVTFQEAISIVQQFQGTQMMAMTSVGLPGSRHKQVIVPHQLAAKSARASMPLQSIIKLDGSERQSIPRQLARAKSNVISARASNSRGSGSLNANLDYPAQLVQSQILRQPNQIIQNQKIRVSGSNLNGSNNNLPPPNQFTRVSTKLPIQRPRQLHISQGPNQYPLARDPIPSYKLQELQQSKTLGPSHTPIKFVHGIPRNLETIPQNIDSSVISEDTVRNYQQPYLAVNFRQNATHNNLSQISLVGINSTDGVSKGILRNNGRSAKINSVGDEYVNSSYSPALIQRGYPQITESVPVFSNIQYGRGMVINNRHIQGR